MSRIRVERFALDTDTFAAERKQILERSDERLRDVVKQALIRMGLARWKDPVVARALEVFDSALAEELDESSQVVDEMRDEFERELRAALDKTKAAANLDQQTETITRWISTMAVNAGTETAVVADIGEDALGLEWVTMGDGEVRDSHVDANGQIVPQGEPFSVAGEELLYPGQPVGDPSVWINCRCLARPTMLEKDFTGKTETASVSQLTDEAVTAAAPLLEEEVIEEGVEEEDAPPEIDQAEDELPVPWHGILAPEGVPSGDKRMFALESLTNRDLPIPLKRMPADAPGHDGSFVVGRIDKVWKDEKGVVWGEGVFDYSEAGYESIRLIAEKMLRGLSVDVDGVEGEIDENGQEVYTAVRISAVTLCAIPAFAEAQIFLGPYQQIEEDEVETEDMPVENPSVSQLTDKTETFAAPGLKKDGTPPVCKYCDQTATQYVLHSEGMAYVPACDEHIEQAKTDAADGDPGNIDRVGDYAGLSTTFDIPPRKTKDGPGWITEPKPTKRITAYWVDGRGAAKIGWGAPGDFNRCRLQLAKYVQNPEWLAGLCANLHYRALKAWPGQASGKVTEMSNLVAAATATTAEVLPSKYFRDPKLEGPTRIKVTEPDENGYRRVYGHIATWDTCHIGVMEACRLAEPSATNYAYFLTGEVDTDAGPVEVGQITMGGGHADLRLGVRAAAAHYDSTSAAVADIAVGDDATGIWCNGVMRPDVTEKQVYELRAAGTLSGDWRGVTVGGQRVTEMVAALAVNVGGFPIPKTKFANNQDGSQLALVAAGVVQPQDGDDDIDARLDAALERREKRVKAAKARATVRAFKAEQIKARVNAERG